MALVHAKLEDSLPLGAKGSSWESAASIPARSNLSHVKWIRFQRGVCRQEMKEKECLNNLYISEIKIKKENQFPCPLH